MNLEKPDTHRKNGMKTCQPLRKFFERSFEFLLYSVNDTSKNLRDQFSLRENPFPFLALTFLERKF